jgi:hypothetical protein
MIYNICNISDFDNIQSQIHNWMIENVENYNAQSWAVIENCPHNDEVVAIPLPINIETPFEGVELPEYLKPIYDIDV